MTSTAKYVLWVATVVTLLSWFHTASGSIDSELMNFIRDYFSHRNISIVVIFACSDFDSHALVKFLSTPGKLWTFAPGLEQQQATLNTIMPQTFYRMGVYLDHTCQSGAELLLLNSEREHLNEVHHWLIYSDTPQVPADVAKLRLRVDTELMWVTREKDSGTITMHDLYKVDYDWPVISTTAGTWHVSTGLSYTCTQWKYHPSRRGDLTGLNLLAVLIINGIPLDNIDEDIRKPESREKDLMAVYNYLVNSHIRRKFNFTATVVPTSDYGYVVQEGKYEGLVKIIGEREANMTMSSMIMNSQKRLDHVQFIAAPTWSFRLAAIFRHPPVTGGYGALLQPFTPTLWLCAMLMWLLIAVLLRLMAWVQDGASRGHDENLGDKHTWSDVMLLIAGTLGEQGTDLDSRWITWRLVFLTMLVLTVLLNNYYGACVVSSLLSEAPFTIRTVKDFIDSDLRFSAEDNNYNSKFLEFDSDRLVHELYTKKMLGPRGEKPVYYTREEGVRKMLHERFAYHVEAITVYDMIERTFPDKEKCALVELSVYPPRKSYLSVPFNSPFKEIITSAMLCLGENGILTHMNLELLPQKPTCSSKGDLISVGLVYTVPAFGILFIGIVLSVVVMVFELVRAWHYKNL